MALKKDGKRVVGDVKFTCPICDTEYTKREVSIPPKDVGMHDINIESIVVVTSGTNASGIGLCAELTMQCTKCNVKLKQFAAIVT